MLARTQRGLQVPFYDPEVDERYGSHVFQVHVQLTKLGFGCVIVASYCEEERITKNTYKERMIATTTYQQQLRRRKKYDQDKDTVVNETGETQSLLGRLDDICQNEVEICHSPFENAPWDVNKDFQTVDILEVAVMTVFLLPQLLLLYPILFMLLLPPVASNLLYMYILVPSISDTIPSSTTSWKLHCIVQAILCIPSAVVALMR